jgi:hypothetical protein
MTPQDDLAQRAEQLMRDLERDAELDIEDFRRIHAVVRDLLASNRELRKERDDFERALSNHLCKYDMADWIACAGGHGTENCEVCDEADKGQHRHELQVRAESAERERDQLREQVENAPWKASYQQAMKELAALRSERDRLKAGK